MFINLDGKLFACVFDMTISFDYSFTAVQQHAFVPIEVQ